MGNHKHEMSLKAKSYIGTMNGTKENLFWYVNVANQVYESKLKIRNVFDPVDSLAAGFDPPSSIRIAIAYSHVLSYRHLLIC